MHCYLIDDANEWVNGISTVPCNSPAILHLWERAYSVGGKEVPFVLSSSLQVGRLVSYIPGHGVTEKLT